MSRRGVPEPNYTQAPNLLFDELLPVITSLAELKVTMVVIRDTIGYHRDEKRLSFTKLQQRTGLSRASVNQGLKLALERGTVERRVEGVRGAEQVFYALNLTGRESELGTGQESKPVTGTGSIPGGEPRPVGNLHRSGRESEPAHIEKEKSKENAGPSTAVEAPATTEIPANAGISSGDGERKSTAQQGEADERALRKLAPELLPFVDPVFEALVDVAEQVQGATAPTKAAVARALESFPRKDFIPAAQAYLNWRLHTRRGQHSDAKEIVLQFRKWLAREPDAIRKTSPQGASASPDRRSHTEETRQRLREAEL